MVSPSSSLEESELQGEPIGRWVEDDGESERLPVMGEIGVALRQHHPVRKQADFHRAFRHEKAKASLPYTGLGVVE